MSEIADLIKKEKSIALLAPSFAIDFEYPNIIGMLRHLGFNEVTELTYGAKIVNQEYAKYIKSNPDQQYYITSPCPTTVATIQKKYPDLTKYLVPVVSPMAAMARFVRKSHPDFKIIFIAPCFAKKAIEAPKYPECIDGVITFAELQAIFDEKKIAPEDFKSKYFFDSLVQNDTKIYPISGGLAKTSRIKNIFKEDEILVTDGIANIIKALDDVQNKTSKYRFFDFLNCPGGCIGGPAIMSKSLSTSERKEKIMNYMKKASEDNVGATLGVIEYSGDIDFSAKFINEN